MDNTRKDTITKPWFIFMSLIYFNRGLYYIDKSENRAKSPKALCSLGFGDFVWFNFLYAMVQFFVCYG